MKSTIILIAIACIELQAVSILKNPPMPELDQQNMFNAIYTFPEQMEQGLRIGKRISLNKNYEHIDHVLIAGMGGSAMAGDIAKSLAAESSTPITVQKNYSLPAWANERTLVICLSYSGNTEETLNCFKEAHEKQLPIIGICTGGQLLEELLTHDYDHVVIPGGMQPRAALGYLVTPLVHLLGKLDVIDSAVIAQVEKVPQHLKLFRDTFTAQERKNPAYLFATNLKQCMPVIFAEAATTGCIAYRWAAQLAENSKMVSRVLMLPELNHNEVVGWKNNPHILKSSVIVWLSDPAMHERNHKRIGITKQLLEGLAVTQLQFQGSGENWPERLFYLIYFGDWISYWSAMAHTTDPTPIGIIDALKQKMKEG